ncbi:MAG: family N-acetyltransferase [Flaviaesturariibacter sp.]|nr:family N-acetyltransferase [Flaviaesturariibacter sp.]
MISLVRLTPDDAPMLAAVGSVSLIESHGHSAAPEVMQQYVDKSFSEAACRAELEDEQNIFYGIFYKDQPAGYSKIVLDVPHPAVSLQPVTKMERLYLLKAFYELKLGTQLMEVAISLSKNAGEKGMWLNVWKKNERAIRFYKKQGFETVGESEFVLTAIHSNPNWVLLLRYD